MNTAGRHIICALISLLAFASTNAISEDLVISDFTNGHIDWSNANKALYYTVEYKSDLTETDSWTASYNQLQDIQSTQAVISAPVGVFYRVIGRSNRTYFAATVPRTGQTNSYWPSDDGESQAGVKWPIPRFTILSDTNVVLDNLTGLMWARNADLAGTWMNWTSALAFCESLDYGGHSDWRLPSVRELYSLIDHRRWSPPVCNTVGDGGWTENDPFVNLSGGFYWSSTTVAYDAGGAWIVYFDYGHVEYGAKGQEYRVWPVRKDPDSTNP